MGTPHKHAALIKAWADGAEIQVRDLTNYSCPKDCKWKDLSTFDDYIWLEDWEYRIKPKTIRYRVALVNTGEYTYTITCNGDAHEQNVETSSYFIKWLGDWQEVEV